MRQLFEKPLSDWEWSDIGTLISNEVEESQYFEFKATLPSRDGGTDPWQSGRPRVSDYARDTIAEEMAAFANSYGGLLILGVSESEDNPPRAAALGNLIRDCVDCAARLDPAIRSRFDPPIQGFELRALVSPDGNGEGVLVLRVPASSLSPHGVGRPPACYVRRGAMKEPTTMRDLQNIFWETRARSERVRAIQEERRQAIREIFRKKTEGSLFSRYDKKFVDKELAFLAFRCTCIPVQSLAISGIAGKLRTSPMERPHLRDVRASPAFGTGPFPYGWRPKAHGARAEGGPDYSLWTIHDDGLMEAAGLSIGEKHHPGWFAASVAQVLIMAEWLRVKAGRPDIPFVVDCEFLHDGYARIGVGAGQSPNMDPPDEEIRIGPFSVERRAELAAVFSEIEREIWFGLGVPETYHSRLNLEPTFPKG
jgi:hypothetical protein